MDNKKNPYLARLLAAVALITAAVVIYVAVGAAMTADDDTENAKPAKNPPAQVKPKTKKKVYEVQEGDSLTVIAEKTGIPVQRLERLNPGLDPQTLQPGQKLKLR